MILWIKTVSLNKERTMPVHKKEHTTSETKHRTTESPVPNLPAPEEFHHYLCAQIRNATRTVMEAIMQEELERFVGAAWGECTAERKGYRNGFYTRDLATTSGPIEDLKVPRDRAGEFHTQVFCPLPLGRFAFAALLLSDTVISLEDFPNGACGTG
jgi:hypothetical protein